MPGMAGSVAAMASMHQQMSDRAEQQKHVRQHTEDVRLVLLPEKEGRDSQKDAEPQPHGKVKPLASHRFTEIRHGFLTISNRLSVHAAFVVGATCSVASQRRARKLWITTKSQPAYTP